MKIFTSMINGKKDINEQLDFSSRIDKNDTILEIDKCLVKGQIYFENEQLYTRLDINVKLVLASSRSLKPIDYNLSFKLDLVFGSGSDADFALTDQIDLDDIIYGHILLEKPLSIYLDDETPIERKKVVNPAFKELEAWK